MEHDSQQFIRAFLYAPFPVLIHNEDGDIKLVNEQWAAITGYTPEELPSIARWTELAYGKKRDAVKSVIDSLFQTDKVVQEGEFTIRTRDGSKRVWEFSSGPLGKDENGRRLVISMAVDITERKQLEQELAQRATLDGLTGLYNHKVLIERLNDEIKRAQRYSHRLSILLLDLDHFKKINDQHGHATGDAVLVSFARLLQETIRTSDYAARYGGEEFVVVLPETSSEQAYEFGRRLCDRIADHTVSHDDVTVKLTASIGIATYPDHAGNGAELLAAADTAMYEVKSAGRNNLRCAG